MDNTRPHTNLTERLTWIEEVDEYARMMSTVPCSVCGGKRGPRGPHGERHGNKPGGIGMLGQCGHEESRGARGPVGRE
jgi:hypothetical protein